MTQQATSPATPAANGRSTTQDLFALTDEQILGISPEAQDVQIAEAAHSAPSVIPSERSEPRDRGNAAEVLQSREARQDSAASSLPLSETAQAVNEEKAAAPSPATPPQWLAEKMADPQSGAEAREFWNGMQQARQEAASYREIFSKPEDARAAAVRSRTLDEFDSAFYGGAGKSPQEISIARAALAQRLLREDPAAFREMVFAGLRALEHASATPVSRPENSDSFAGALASPAAPGSAPGAPGEPKPAPTAIRYDESQIAGYKQFEKSANEDLDRSVGSAIERVIQQALPNLQTRDEAAAVGARSVVPLRDRLSAAARQDVEAALKADRQLGEQVAQILSSRRFDDATRAQVVRLINDRAQQLVPVAARRVINDWTQATLAAHRTKTHKTSSVVERADLAPANADSGSTRSRSGQPDASGKSPRTSSPSGRVDYGKLTDEQILEL